MLSHSGIVFAFGECWRNLLDYQCDLGKFVLQHHATDNDFSTTCYMQKPLRQLWLPLVWALPRGNAPHFLALRQLFFNVITPEHLVHGEAK